MLNNNKIKIMTKLALYEQGNGKNDIKISHFYKGDYIRYNILKTIVSITVGFLFLFALVGLYNVEYFITNATVINYKQMGIYLLVLYLAAVIVYVILTIIITTIKYKNTRKHLVKYNKDLKELNEIYKTEKSDIR
ncbi:hypothetical protein EDD66_104216 [Mobilisporobacter senegalensis]|uniref:Uncharacterized protein n=1 Tax=Mobilisporobacter senegalensis TaxID=1329262 RepID=A0A3N1XPM1_9FIRM|nr:hypothetical protein [Mobilisporobacter senegalensis]ROR28629.1 hypothetical protein EDD66_104216 [Mobilisporobacter senegalensis]